MNRTVALLVCSAAALWAQTPNRPQNPRPPYPYIAEDVACETGTSATLAGTLTLPPGSGPFAAAVLISGSGPQDRDETIQGHKPFWIIADYLTRRGLAVLRLDDRGVGGSGGKSSETTLSEMADDVLAVVRYLKTRKEIDPKRIGLIGHSEGGLVGPLAATRSSDVAFVVMLAGTGVDGVKLLELQAELVNRSMGVPATAAAFNRSVQQMMIAIVRSEEDPEAAAAKIRVAWRRIKEDAPVEQRALLDGADPQIETGIRRITSRELRSFLLYDPAEALSKLRVPVLVMNGSRDIQVSPRQNLPAILGALMAAENSDITLVEMPGLNHLFQRCRKCSVPEYAELEESFSPAALDVIGEWIVRH